MVSGLPSEKDSTSPLSHHLTPPRITLPPNQTVQSPTHKACGMYMINLEMPYDTTTQSLIGQGKHLQQPSPHNTHVPATSTQTWRTSRSIPWHSTQGTFRLTPARKQFHTFFPPKLTHQQSQGTTITIPLYKAVMVVRK
uniref:Uncharacterized protein n=1 Tax=Arundo donax TaxID=35708 RepID=A0A0A9FHE8_ARUDO